MNKILIFAEINDIVFMKRLLMLVILIVSASLAKAQDAPVITNKMELQTGLFGIWLNKEYKLSNQFAMRAEIGLDAGFWGGSHSTGYIFVPVVTAEPRWYYNLEKRNRKEKITQGNFGNFFSLKTSFHPDLFVISNYSESIIPDLSIVPTWGIRRAISSHFSFETGIGIGYLRNFHKSQGALFDTEDVAVNLHLRFGYRF